MKENPSKEEIINQAIKFHLQGNISEATKYYQFCINNGFEDHKVFSNYGAILKSIGKLQEAEFYLRKAIKLNPNYENAHSNLSITLRDLGELEEAEFYVRKAIELKPDFPDAYSNLGVILKTLGKLEEAENSYRKAIELKPNFENALSNLGNILRELGKLEEAEFYLRKAIELKPNFENALSNLGNILRELGKLEEAEFYTRKAIQLNPNESINHFNLGNILRELGKLEEAENSYHKSIKLKPNWLSYFFYADCIYKKRKFEIVKNQLLEAKSISIKNHQKSYINSALEVTELAKNSFDGNKKFEFTKKSKSLDNKKNRLIFYRKSDSNLLNYLYKIKNRKLNQTIDARYGKGFCSQDLHFFDDQSPIISKLANDLERICKVKLGLEKIMICESFFNIFQSGYSAGAKSHNHIGKRDIPFGLRFHKYSLIYYLEIGDQSGINPGKLKLFEPYEEILPANNMLIIIDADRKHSVSYCGEKDRVVLSANFFGF